MRRVLDPVWKETIDMKIAVLFGGVSSEHEVSCVSAASVLRNLDKEKYEILAIGITQDGRWLYYPDFDADKIERGAWEQENSLIPATLSPDRNTHGLLLLQDDKVEQVRLDCVFPVLHGIGGEDGTMQGLFALAGIPYVGCGVAASANAMDKSITKIIADNAGVRQANYYLACKSDLKDMRDVFLEVERVKRRDGPSDVLIEVPDYPEGDMHRMVRQAEREVGSYPMFVKPCSSGSSVGVTKAKNREELIYGLFYAFQYDDKVLVEEFIDGREIECAVLGNDVPMASTVGEIAPAQEFYSYEAKYHDTSSALYIPARITDAQMEETKENALRVYQALGCKGLSRVDFFCTYDSGDIVFNEINTLPGFTSISMYPKLFEADGIAYSDLLDRLIAYAMEESHG